MLTKKSSIIRPSYHQGFARNAAESKYPHLWKNLKGAWLPFLGPTGNTLHGVGNNKSKGSFVNGPTWVRDKDGASLDFEMGSSQYVLVGDNPGLEFSPNITVSTWIKVESYNDYNVIVSRWDETGNNRVWALVVFATGLVYWYIDADGGNLNFDLINSGAAIGLGVWKRVSATFDGDYMRLYIDGTEVANKDTALTALYTGGTANLWIGGAPKFAGVPQYFDGLISQVNVYNRAFTHAEVIDDYINAYAMFELKEKGTKQFLVSLAIMNQFQGANLGADLYDGTFINLGR
jgi:hypothetical protein